MVGCGQQAPIADESAHPTIVSLNPCTDAILAEVSGPGQLLAISHYSHDVMSTSMDLAIARRYDVTGGTVEEVLALQPDVVVGSDFMTPSTRNAFLELGIRVETIGIASTVADSKAQIRELAAVTGYPAKAAELTSRIDAAVRQAAPISADTHSAVLWQPAGIVPGEGALVTDLLQRAGFTNHSATRGLEQAAYLSLEQMLVDPPDLLLVAGQERGQQHPTLSDMAARGDMRVGQFDASLLYCGGPTIIRALDRLRAIRDGG